MPHNGNRQRHQALSRRSVVATGTTFTGVLAGCLGDDDPDDIDDVDDVDDVEDDADDSADLDEVDDADPGDDTDDTEGTGEVTQIERHDVAPVNLRATPFPADVQYNRWAADAEPTPDLYTWDHYFLMGWSFGDQQLYGQLIDDWSYEPGIIEVTLHDDFYWWSGDVVNAEDWLTQQSLADWFWGGDDFDDNPAIITAEMVDEFTFRLSLADTWNESWAMEQTLVNGTMMSSRQFNEPWIEEFDDTGGDLDAVEDIRDDLDSYSILPNENEDELVYQHNIPFEFRLDGSVGEIGENFWEYELVPEKNGNQRRYVDRINYERKRFEVAEEFRIQQNQAFAEQRMPYLSAEEVEGEHEDDILGIQTRQEAFWREMDQWGWNFNCELQPMESPQFRRAWIFLTDQSLWSAADHRFTQEHAGPFLNDDRTERWVSEEIIADFTDYGPETVEEDRAEEELQIGGFERNGNGDWLDQETGEPIELEVGGILDPDLNFVGDEGSDFFADVNDFGIDATFVPGAQEPWTVEAHYTGGLLPETVFDSIFGEDGLGWAAHDPNLPESVEAPPIGETDADPDEWVEYDTRAMTDRLGVTVEGEPYQDLVDQLAWVANQIVPRVSIAPQALTRLLNDERWHVQSMEEAPEKWLRTPARMLWFNGLLSYVPEDER